MAVVLTEGPAAKRDVKCTGGLVFPLTLCQVRKEEYLQINVHCIMLILNSRHYDWKANQQVALSIGSPLLLPKGMLFVVNIDKFE
jgi:hypothetical protein